MRVELASRIPAETTKLANKGILEFDPLSIQGVHHKPFTRRICILKYMLRTVIGVGQPNKNHWNSRLSEDFY